jgi:hypothetical protein
MKLIQAVTSAVLYLLIMMKISQSRNVVITRAVESVHKTFDSDSDSDSSIFKAPTPNPS